MRTIRIYVDIPLELNNQVILPTEAARHVHKVLRMQPDDPLTLFNGDGHEYIARITDVKPGVTVDVIAAESAETESPLTTHIGLCLNRSERMDYAIQKSTELGVSHIHLVHSRYCDVQLKGERLQKRLKHWRGVMQSACEQSARVCLPTLHTLRTFEDFVQHPPASDCHILLEPESRTRLQDLGRPLAVTALIGPVGGFSEYECDLAKQQGFTPVSLGPRVLRAETAPVTILSILQSQYGDF